MEQSAIAPRFKSVWPSLPSSSGPLFGSPPAGWLIARGKAYGVISASDSSPVNK
jgi:hypothetical protein